MEDALFPHHLLLLLGEKVPPQTNPTGARGPAVSIQSHQGGPAQLQERTPDATHRTGRVPSASKSSTREMRQKTQIHDDSQNKTQT